MTCDWVHTGILIPTTTSHESGPTRGSRTFSSLWVHRQSYRIFPVSGTSKIDFPIEVIYLNIPTFFARRESRRSGEPKSHIQIRVPRTKPQPYSVPQKVGWAPGGPSDVSRVILLDTVSECVTDPVSRNIYNGQKSVFLLRNDKE